MNKILKFILGFVLALLALYLMGSFMAWDFDPGNWDSGGRFALVMIGVPIAVGCGVIFNEEL